MEDKYIVWAHIKNKKYPFCLTIGAADVMEKSFGSVSAAGKSIADHAEKDEVSGFLRAVLTAARPLCDGGVNYLLQSAKFSGDEKEIEAAKALQPLPEDEVLEAILSGAEIVQLWNSVLLALKGGSSREIEVAPDNSPKNADSAT